MTVKTVLAVSGVDLDDDDTLELLGLHFSDLGWEALGTDVTAAVLSDSADPVADALAVAHRIESVLPGSRVTGLDDEFVGLSEIAGRVAVSTEAVRLWASGQRRAASTPVFPRPVGRLAQGRTSVAVWVWADVVRWLRDAFCLDPEPGVEYLSRSGSLALSAELADERRAVGRWKSVATGGFDRTLARIDEVLEVGASRRPAARFVSGRA